MKADKTTNFQTIALFGRTKLDEHKAFIDKLHTNLLKRKKTIIWDEHMSPYLGNRNEHERASLLKQADLVITLGGDGTILKLVRDMPKRNNLYILGVNLGNVGFNTEVKNKEKTFSYLDEIFTGNFSVDERLLLRVTLYRGGKKIETHLALNEAVINQGNFARLISLRAEIDQRKMLDFKADGVIVATPTGSTGHSLSAGGPIVHPRVDGIIFTPICPSLLSVRPIVIPSNRQLTIHVDTERRFVDNTIGLTIDGQIVTPIQYGDIIKIRRSSRKMRLIRSSQITGNYYKLLREKLSWGV